MAGVAIGPLRGPNRSRERRKPCAGADRLCAPDTALDVLPLRRTCGSLHVIRFHRVGAWRPGCQLWRWPSPQSIDRGRGGLGPVRALAAVAAGPGSPYLELPLSIAGVKPDREWVQELLDSGIA